MILYALFSKNIVLPAPGNNSKLLIVVLFIFLSGIGYLLNMYSFGGYGDYGDDDEIFFFIVLTIILSALYILFKKNVFKTDINNSLMYKLISIFFLICSILLTVVESSEFIYLDFLTIPIFIAFAIAFFIEKKIKII